MALTEEEKAQKAAEQRIGELEERLAKAEEAERKAAEKADALEAEVAAARVAAPMPLGASGTITVNAAGEVVTD